MASIPKDLVEKLKAKLPAGANVIGGDRQDPVVSGTAARTIYFTVYPDNTIHKVTMDEWPDGFDIVSDEQVGTVWQ